MSGTIFLQTRKPDTFLSCICWASETSVSNSWIRIRNRQMRRAEKAITEGKLRVRGWKKERIVQGRRNTKMEKREPVRRWGSISQCASLCFMLMLTSASKLKQEKLLEATANTLTRVLTVSTNSICLWSRYLITSSFSTSLSKSSRTVISLERASSSRRAQQAQKRQMLAREERLRREICCRFFILGLAAAGRCDQKRWKGYSQLAAGRCESRLQVTRRGGRGIR